MIQITDISDPRIKNFRDLRKIANDNTENKYFVAEGEKVVFKLLNSNLEIISIFSTFEFYLKYSDLINSRINDKSNLLIAEKDLMSQIVGYKIHSGIMALAKEKQSTELKNLDDRIIVLNNIIDTENVGSIIRNCVAFDFNSIIFDNSTSSPYLRRAVRVSIGNIFNIKYNKSLDLKSDLLVLKKQIWI